MNTNYISINYVAPDNRKCKILFSICKCGEYFSNYTIGSGLNRGRYSMCPDCSLAHRKGQHKSAVDKRVQAWLSGEWSASKGSMKTLSETIRNYLLKEAGYKCQRCEFDTPHPVDGRTILEIDHINGDGTDHSPNNLIVLCPNCHALTPTYRARNTGNGRPVHYVRVTR